ncbi:10518_t:CDS:2, partial [Ambispora leptoticha]
VSKAIHDFFDQEGFYYVPTPIITSNDAEGTGATFNLTTNQKKSFFSKPAQLTVSGQLHAEALAQGLGKVYTFSPCFRAEKSHTTRHLADSVLANCSEELKYFEKYQAPEIIPKLVAITKKEFAKIDYTQAIKILKKVAKKFTSGSRMSIVHTMIKNFYDKYSQATFEAEKSILSSQEKEIRKQ